VILLHDNARPHVAKIVKNTYVPSDYHLFRSMQHSLFDQHFKTCEEIKKLINEWIQRTNIFFIMEFTYCQKSEKNLKLAIKYFE